MNERIEIEKQIEGLKDRVRFLGRRVTITANMINQERDRVEDEKDKFKLSESQMKIAEWQDGIFKYKTEARHNEYLIEVRGQDLKMLEKQHKANIEALNKEMGGMIGQLRTKIFPDPKHQKLAKGVIKRFGKEYKHIQEKIVDFNIAQTLLK